MKKILCCLWMVYASPLFAQAQPGIFDGQTDIGHVARKGSAVYNAQQQEYMLSGAGANTWFDHDELHFVWKKMKGDFILRTQVAFIGKGVEAHRKIGWMIRPSLDSTAAHVDAVVHGDGLTSLQFRKKAGTNMEEIKSSVQGADIIQLERKGNRYIMSVAKKGGLLVSHDISAVDLGDEVYAGIFICSHNANVTEKATFSNVRIVVPARENFTAYREYIGSDLEILNVADGKSRIIYQSPRSLQAPNWMHNGKSLIYNSEGRIYKFDLASKKPALLNTGTIIKNNNDHVLSFDGNMVGLSSNPPDGNASVVYTMPVAGGEPKRITPLSPSYLHGWSPNGNYLVFTGQRNNEFDIYRIPSKGGEEIRLTTAPGLDDGPEYSPDGKYIYFNSVRSGTMQLWRMLADGSQQEQLTNDDMNNWFPHISPDGKWIVYLSFEQDVKPSDHPFYKHVYLRLMPAGGGPSKVIAYVYGGQGTINTPSWSPDSKHIAFISNTQLLFNTFPVEK